MKLGHLFEAGIKTAEIDKLAREALGKAIPATVKEVIKQTEADMPPRKMRGDTGYEYEDTSERGTELLDLYQQDQEALVVPMLERFSSVLTQVVREYVADLIPSIPHLVDFLKNFSSVREPTEFAQGYKVSLEARELSTDDYAAKSNGYMGVTDMKVFVDQDKVFAAGRDLIEEEMFGESMSDGYRAMINAIIPTFVHEYAHLEQSLRRPTTWNKKRERGSRDFGYVTSKTSRSKKNSVGGRGGRGEWARTPWDSDEANLRYYGNVREIDSFASDAAAEIMSGLQSQERRAYGWQRYWNENIDDLKSNLVYGHDDSSRSFATYRNMMWNAFDDAYAHVGLKPEQMKKVWQTFVKKVVLKLDDYKIENTDTTGRDMRLPDRSQEADYPDRREPMSRANFAQQFALAGTKPFAEAVKALAANRARSLGNDERARQQVAQGFADDMHMDEMFIAERFTHGEYSAMGKKAIAIYRELVGRYMDRLNRSAA